MQRLSICVLAILTLAGCKQKADTKPLDAAGVRFTVIERLREMNVSANEVNNVVRAKEAGMSDQNCLELVRMSRSRGAEFDDGESIVTLAGVQFTEDEVMELARLNQLGLWIGEVQAMRFAGVNKPVIMTLARARSKGRPALSAPNIVRLQDAGYTDNQMMQLIDEGTTDAQAAAMVRARTPSGPSHFRRLR